MVFSELDMAGREFIILSYELEQSGLIWQPEIGDEVCPRGEEKGVSILVDPQGLTPIELRQTFIWLPTVEQLVEQIEAREGLLYHAGVSKTFDYETVIKTAHGLVEACASTLRIAIGRALQEVLRQDHATGLH